MSKVFAIQVSQSDMDTTEVLFCYGSKEKRFVEERPHGEWIEANSTDLKCSICGHRELKERTLVTFLEYCSLCGAKMRPIKGGDEE